MCSSCGDRCCGLGKGRCSWPALQVMLTNDGCCFRRLLFTEMGPENVEMYSTNGAAFWLALMVGDAEGLKV